MTSHALQIRRGTDPTFLDNNPSVLVRIGPSLGRDHVFLAGVWSESVDVTVLENDGGVSEDEVDGSNNEAFDEVLTVRVDIESVLVS